MSPSHSIRTHSPTVKAPTPKHPLEICCRLPGNARCCLALPSAWWRSPAHRTIADQPRSPSSIPRQFPVSPGFQAHVRLRLTPINKRIIPLRLANDLPGIIPTSPEHVRPMLEILWPAWAAPERLTAPLPRSDSSDTQRGALMAPQSSSDTHSCRQVH